MYNIMLDIETLGTKSNSVILSIAAVKFEFGSDNIDVFSINIDPKSSKALGMVVDSDTIAWWKSQPKEALEAFMSDQVSITDALQQFVDWVGPEWKKIVWWANGANFDYPVIEWSLNATKISPPWKYWNCRDARTIYSVCGLNMKEYPRVGMHHNAVDDCRTQIKALKECLLGLT